MHALFQQILSSHGMLPPDDGDVPLARGDQTVYRYYATCSGAGQEDTISIWATSYEAACAQAKAEFSLPYRKRPYPMFLTWEVNPVWDVAATPDGKLHRRADYEAMS